jgi:hypothetical protein
MESDAMMATVVLYAHHLTPARLRVSSSCLPMKREREGERKKEWLHPTVALVAA